MKLFFKKSGQGPALIILHGLFGSSDNWATVAKNLSSNFTVYLVDLRNHGKSPHHADHSFQAMVADLDELIVSENLKKVILLGHSMGGKTAMMFAAMFPEKISGLIVVDVGPGGYASTDSYSPHVTNLLNITNAMQSVDLSKVTSREEVGHELSKTIKNSTVRQFIMKNLHRNHDNSFCWKLNVDVISKAIPQIMGPIHIDKILGDKTLNSFPILFIKGGGSDYLIPGQLSLIHQFFPDSIIETIQGAGHWVHADQPMQFMTVLNKFLINNRLS